MMRFVAGVALLFGLVVGLVVGPVGPSLAAESGRTFFDRLQLDTPEHAARTFVDAYAAGDYWTVYLVMDPKTQAVVSGAINNLEYELIVRTRRPFEQGMVTLLYPNLSDSEQPNDYGWVFDFMMVAARDQRMLPFEMASGAKIGAPEGTPPHLTVETADGPVTVQLVQSSSGRWRVQSAVRASGHPERLPWGLPYP